MGTRRNDDDDFLEEEWAPYGSDGDDPDDWEAEAPLEDDDLIDCPECGEAIHAESERCPECGHYLTDDETQTGLWTGRPWWWLVLGGLGIAAVIYALSRP